MLALSSEKSHCASAGRHALLAGVSLEFQCFSCCRIIYMHRKHFQEVAGSQLRERKNVGEGIAGTDTIATETVELNIRPIQMA